MTLAPHGVEGMELAFEFYGRNNQMIKTESILILASGEPFALPKWSIKVTPGTDLNDATNASIKTTVETQQNFKIVDDLTVSFHTHLGWNVGPQTSFSLQDQLNQKTHLFGIILRHS